MSKITYKWDESTGTAVCSILYNDTEYVGVAQCHPDDDDFKSELIGSELAYLRACLKVLQGTKREKWVELKAYKSLEGSLVPSPRFNPDSFEAKMLTQKIDTAKEDIDIIKECIEDLRNKIYTKIEASEKFYQGVRKNRKQREEALKEVK